MSQKTVKELRDAFIALCDQGHGDLPVSTSRWDKGTGRVVLGPYVICVGQENGEDRYFSKDEVDRGCPESRGMETPAPTFVVIE